MERSSSELPAALIATEEVEPRAMQTPTNAESQYLGLLTTILARAKEFQLPTPPSEM